VVTPPSEAGGRPTVGLFAIALISVPFLGTEFMPKLDEGYLIIETDDSHERVAAARHRRSDDVERTLRKFPRSRTVVTNLGRPRTRHRGDGTHQADVYVS